MALIFWFSHVNNNCECCQSLLRFYTRHPERAVKLWFIAVTHLWGLCYTRFITIAAVKVHQEAKSSHHHHLTWADVVQPIKSNHYLMSNVTRINILHLSLPSVCRDVQLKRKKKWRASVYLQMDSCEQTELSLHHITALNNEYGALRTSRLSALCCLCGTVRVTRPGRRSGSAHTDTLDPSAMNFSPICQSPRNVLHALNSCGPRVNRKKGSISASGSLS